MIEHKSLLELSLSIEKSLSCVIEQLVEGEKKHKKGGGVELCSQKPFISLR